MGASASCLRDSRGLVLAHIVKNVVYVHYVWVFKLRTRKSKEQRIIRSESCRGLYKEVKRTKDCISRYKDMCDFLKALFSFKTLIVRYRYICSSSVR